MVHMSALLCSRAPAVKPVLLVSAQAVSQQTLLWSRHKRMHPVRSCFLGLKCSRGWKWLQLLEVHLMCLKELRWGLFTHCAAAGGSGICMGKQLTVFVRCPG